MDQPFNINLESSPGVEYTCSPTINVLILGSGCTYATPTKIDLVISGVEAKDEVYVGLSTTKDDPNILAQTQNKVRLGSDLKLLAWFSINNIINNSIALPGLGTDFSVDPQQTGMCLMLPVNLPEDLYSMLGNEFYIQTISFPNGRYDWSGARTSDLVKIKVDTKTCSVY